MEEWRDGVVRIRRRDASARRWMRVEVDVHSKVIVMFTQKSSWVLELLDLVQGCSLNPAAACAACGGVMHGPPAAFQNREPGTRPGNSGLVESPSSILDAATEKKKQVQLSQCRGGPHIPRVPWTKLPPGSGSLGSVSRIITTGPRTGPLPRAGRDDATAESRPDVGPCPVSAVSAVLDAIPAQLCRVWSGLAPRRQHGPASFKHPTARADLTGPRNPLETASTTVPHRLLLPPSVGGVQEQGHHPGHHPGKRPGHPTPEATTSGLG